MGHWVSPKQVLADSVPYGIGFKSNKPQKNGSTR